MYTKKEGFTLIELLVVISVIAVLMGILIPTLSRARESAKRTVCGNQLRQIGVAMRTYCSENANRLPYYGAKKDPDPYKSDMDHPYAVYRGDKAQYRDAQGNLEPMKLARLYESKHIPNPELFYCPSNMEKLYKYESYTDPEPWGSLPQKFNSDDVVSHNQWVRIGYTYFPIEKNTPLDADGAPERTARKFDLLSPHMPYTTDIVRRKDQISHQRNDTYAINALFSDGHIRLCNENFVFDDGVWDEYKYGVIDIKVYYYRVFQLIHP